MKNEVYEFLKQKDWQLSIFNSREGGLWVAAVAPQHELLAIIEDFYNSTDKRLRAEAACLFPSLNLPFYSTDNNIENVLEKLGEKLKDLDVHKTIYVNNESEYSYIDFFDDLYDLEKESDIPTAMYKIMNLDESLESYEFLKFLIKNTNTI